MDCQLLLPSSPDPLDLKYPECLLQFLLALTWDLFFIKGYLPFLSLVCIYFNTWHFRMALGMASSSLHPRGLFSLSPQCLVHSARMERADKVHGSQVPFFPVEVEQAKKN